MTAPPPFPPRPLLSLAWLALPLALAAFGGPPDVFAQNVPGSGASAPPPAAALPDPTLMARPEVDVARADRVPTVDGDVLGDAAWERVAALDTFWQTTPDAGAPATERTEVRLAYTADTLFVGVVCYDRDPAAIIVSESRRDSPLDETDSFMLILDTYRDRQNGFVFGTNPSGLEYDGQVTNEGQGGSIVMGGQQIGSGGGFNLNWDGSWTVKTRVSEVGWSAEFAIPFRTLRYPSADAQRWGVNFQRNIRRRNERAFWAALPSQFSLFRLSQAGLLTGMRVAAQRNLKLIPYLSGRTQRESAPESGKTLGDVGGDIKYGVTPSLTLDGTINTDFAQVEVDEVQINLDRFNLFYPEKRPFFLENAGLFAVGAPAEVELFFSRRVGLDPSGATIPIVAGARLSGQVAAGWHVGLLNMQTATEDLTPASNFTVARLRRDLPNRSSAGAIVVNREGTGRLSGRDDYNRTVAVDGRWGIGRYASVSGYVGRSETPGVSGDEHAFEVNAQRDSPRWQLTTTAARVGRHFNPEAGFLAREGGYRKWQGLVFHRYRPKALLRLHEVRPHASYNGYWLLDGRLQSGFAHFDSHFEWKNGYEVHTGFNMIREGVFERFEIHPGIWVPVGTYDSREAAIVFNTNLGAPVSLSTRVNAGGFFGGSRVAITPTLRFRVGDRFTTQLSVARNEIDLPVGRFATTLARTRVSYSFTPRVFIQSLLQYNDRSNIWSANLRFGWLQQANTGLFIVYNDAEWIGDERGADGLLLRRTGPASRSLVIKFSRMFDLLQ
jgi:Domain of unknown function (DUF5916)